MRRLIVQMQMSVDGIVASDPPDVDWTVWDWGPDCRWDAVLQRDFNTVYDSVDTILLSRIMIEEGLLEHWTFWKARSRRRFAMCSDHGIKQLSIRPGYQNQRRQLAYWTSPRELV